MKYDFWLYTINSVCRTNSNDIIVLIGFFKDQFFFKCWEFQYRKKLRKFFEMSPSCPQALHLKPCLSFLLDGSSLPKDLSLRLSFGVGKRSLSLNTRSCHCPLSSLSSHYRPWEPLNSSDWFRRFSRCLSSTDHRFTSLVTASTQSFVSSRLIIATFAVCSSSSILVTASGCNALSKTASIFIFLWPICFLRSKLTWLWFILSRNPLKTGWSLISCDSVGYAFKANCFKFPRTLWLIFAALVQINVAVHQFGGMDPLLFVSNFVVAY